MTPSRGSRFEARILTMRTSPRDGLHALASAWHATQGASVAPFVRPLPASPARPEAAGSRDAEPPYWPDGPSAA